MHTPSTARYHHPFPGPLTVKWYSVADLITPGGPYVYAPAYRVTPPPDTEHGPQLWRGTTVRSAVETSTRRPPAGWPEPYTTFHPDGRVEFTGPLLPWHTTIPVWTAAPAAAPENWGCPCAHCGVPESEHCAWCAPWLRRPDGTSCHYGTYTPAE